MTKHDENAYLREAVIGLQSKLAEYVHKYEQAIYELELVYREREAAINDLRKLADCDHCKHCKAGECEIVDFVCSTCPVKCMCKNCKAGCNWEWRGIQEDASCAT